MAARYYVSNKAVNSTTWVGIYSTNTRRVRFRLRRRRRAVFQRSETAARRSASAAAATTSTIRRRGEALRHRPHRQVGYSYFRSLSLAYTSTHIVMYFFTEWDLFGCQLFFDDVSWCCSWDPWRSDDPVLRITVVQ